MKLKKLLSYTLIAAFLGLSSTANAEFFSSPFDMWDNNDDYRYNNYRDGRSNGADRWRRYDEWEPNYWRYRYFDDDSNDYFFDEFDSGFFGDGRGDFNFDMNMDTDSRFDGRYDNDSRYRGDGRRYGNDYNRPARRSDDGRRYSNDRRYQDSSKRDSRRYGNSSSGRRMSDTPEYQQYQRRREERRAEQPQPVECR